jgi:hypothetical protein
MKRRAYTPIPSHTPEAAPMARFTGHIRSMTFAALALTACGKTAEPHGPQVSISSAALTLPGVAGVEYALAVFNAAPTGTIFDIDGVAANTGSLVWNEPSVTSTQYGDGKGDITYIGTCDASVAENWAALSLRKIAVGDGAGSYSGAAPYAGSDNLLDDQNSAASTSPGSGDGDADFVNPCPYQQPCVAKFRCAENEDTPVTFNITVMRDAQQGFFDLAVDFDDIFCSAKLDTCYEGNAPINLLHGADGERDRTAVMATACTAGAGTDVTTVLWMSAVNVTCDGDISFPLDPTGDEDGDPQTPGIPGNHQAEVVLAGGERRIIGYGVYWGDEQLMCDGASCNKAYWNLALNLADLEAAGLTNCHLRGATTASAAPALDRFVAGMLPGPGQTYGVVAFDGQVQVGTRASCVQGPMGSEVTQVIYGASPDMVGATPFPRMCSYYQRGSQPRALAAESGYFSDSDGLIGLADYSGRASIGAPLSLGFAGMGNDDYGPCNSRVSNTSTALWIDGMQGATELSWKGSGGTGRYRIEIFAADAALAADFDRSRSNKERGLPGPEEDDESNPWRVLGGYEVDLSTALGRTMFTAGSTFVLEGDSALGIVLTRLDYPVAVADDIGIEITR